MNRRLKSFLTLSLSSLLLTSSIHAATGFEIKLPVKIPSVPGLPSGTGTIQEAAKKEAIKAIIKQLGGDTPTQNSLDARKHFKTVKVENFHGKEIKIRNQADLFRFYEPGDYWFNFYGICNKGSIHSPSQGIPTVLGRATGKRLPIVSEIGFAAVGKNVDPRLMQYMSTMVESGLPFRSWRPELQKVAQQLIPMYIPDLQGDPIEELREKYNAIRSKSPLKLPDLEGFLQQYMPEEWQLYQEIQRERKILTDERIAAEHVPERLIAQDGTPAQLPPYQGRDESEWGEIAPGVYGRAIIIRGFAGMPGPAPYNRFELRITSEAHSLFTQRDAAGKALVKAGKTSPVTKPPVAAPGTVKPANDNNPNGFDPRKVKGQGGNVISYPFGKPGTTLAETLYKNPLIKVMMRDPKFRAIILTAEWGEEIGADAMQYYLDHNPEVRKWMTEAMNTSPKQAAQSLTISAASEKEPDNKENDCDKWLAKIKVIAATKIPASWGVGDPATGGCGWRWRNPLNNAGNYVRIDKANPTATEPGEHVDHVHVKSGQVIGGNGKPILKTPTVKKPEGETDAHIPLSVWATWRSWDKP